MKKLLSHYDNLSRLSTQSHFRAVLKPGQYNTLAAYTPENVLAWTENVAKYWFGKKHPFVRLPGTASGIYKMPPNAKISMAGDWGTGTQEAEMVANQIRSGDPDYTIHLGDTYYAGSRSEIMENFLGIKISAYEPTEWPRGSLGTFALPGNHEMYSNGTAYFETMLPTLTQQSSYFCLENADWRIIGLDTAYNSTGVDLGPFKPSCKLPQEILDWLKTLKLDEDARGLILLTHHQPWSAFESEFDAPVKQLTQFIKRPVLWFWGHEHRMAVYGFEKSNGISGYGRCIGHGGMPVSLKAPGKKRNCVFTDSRQYQNTEDLKVGYNGFVRLSFSGPSVLIEYIDLHGLEVYSEKQVVS